MQKQIDLSREQFERWAVGQGLSIEADQRGRFVDPRTADVWIGWQGAVSCLPYSAPREQEQT